MASRGAVIERKQNELLREKIRDLTGAGSAEPAFAPLRADPGAAQILAAARRAGVLDEFDGMPAADRFSEFSKRRVETLAARCFDDGPFSAAAEAVLREMPDRVAEGLRLAAKACGAKRLLVVAADRKEARRFMKAVRDVPVTEAGTRYPASLFLQRRWQWEGKRVGMLGAQACVALADAARGVPQTKTVVTAAGDGFRRPGNYRVLIGAPAEGLLKAAGLMESARLVAVGSSVTGESLSDVHQTIAADCRCLTASRHPPFPALHPCIRCGRCAKACPVGILPWLIHRELESASPDVTLFFHVTDCISCRACTFVCPSGIALREEVARAAELKEGDAE